MTRSGNVIAYNDDSFQDLDSTIIDLTLPETGTYYVEVTAADKPGEPTNQTGAYELFMYTFATDGDPPAGDTMYAGSGDDTLIGGAGDDTIAAHPNDTIIYGSGTPTFLSNAPYLDVTVSGPTPAGERGTERHAHRLVHRPRRRRHAYLRLARGRLERPADRRRVWSLVHVQPRERRDVHRHVHRVGRGRRGRHGHCDAHVTRCSSGPHGPHDHAERGGR